MNAPALYPAQPAHAGDTPHGPSRVDRGAIEREARRAAQAGALLRDACPYPWGTEAEKHFTAVFLVAGGKVTP